MNKESAGTKCRETKFEDTLGKIAVAFSGVDEAIGSLRKRVDTLSEYLADAMCPAASERGVDPSGETVKNELKDADSPVVAKMLGIIKVSNKQERDIRNIEYTISQIIDRLEV